MLPAAPLLVLLVAAVSGYVAFADDIEAMPGDQSVPDGGLYTPNRPPLQRIPFLRLPVGTITPRGWVRRQVELDASGMMGHLAIMSPYIRDDNGWVDAASTTGWEEFPYWIKGYGDIGYVLHDQSIIATVSRVLQRVMAAQRSDGWFGPDAIKSADHGHADTWPHSPLLMAVRSYYEYTGDAHAIDFISKFLRWQTTRPASDFQYGWGAMRISDYLDTIHWLYNRTGDSWLLALATTMHSHSADFVDHVPNWHNVNFAQGFREPSHYFLQSPDSRFRSSAYRTYDLMMERYGQVPGGGFGGDENCRPGHIDPHQGFETCGIVEFMHSFETLARLNGDPVWLDRAEDLAFNSLPAALTPDHHALHYLTAPNQVQLDQGNKHPTIDDSGTMFSYSPYEVYRCCQHNHGMGWSYYAEELWSATADGGLAAMLYADSAVSAKVSDGQVATIDEATDYPFSPGIELTVTVDRRSTFPLYLRIPHWCRGATFAINGIRSGAVCEPGRFMRIRRTWASGDRVTVSLPMEISLRTWTRNAHAISVDLGPLTFSLAIGERWKSYGDHSAAWNEWELFPTTSWNYALVLDQADPASSFIISHRPGHIDPQPFTAETAPISLTASARRIPAWDIDHLGVVDALQPSPVRTSEPTESITLIPMGAARLRIAAFPVVGDGPDSHVWAPISERPVASASHVCPSDSVDALVAGIEPATSHDQGMLRFTWWDHRGTSEWAQITFAKPTTLGAVSVYWFDDGAGCRVPDSWRVSFHEGERWVPVANASTYGTSIDCYNRVTFAPVRTSALRIEAQLRRDMSAGILAWRCLPPDPSSE